MRSRLGLTRTAPAGTDARPSRAAPAGTAPAGTDARPSLRELSEMALFLNRGGACKVEISNYDHGGIHFTAIFSAGLPAGAASGWRAAVPGPKAQPRRRKANVGPKAQPRRRKASMAASAPGQRRRKASVAASAPGQQKQQRQDAPQREAHDGPPRVRGCGAHNTASNQGTLSSI